MMRTIALLLLLLATLLSACATRPPLDYPVAPEIPPLVFAIPQVERRNLDNGLRLYLHPEHELPLVTISLMIGAGSIGETEPKAGLVDLYAASLRGGGAGRLTPEEFDQELDRLAADLSFRGDIYAVNGTLSLHRDDLETGLALLAELLRRPRFDSRRISLYRGQLQERIRRQNDEPRVIARRKLLRALYGDHPLGQSATIASLDAVGRDDLLAFHRRYVLPNNLWLAISGDFDPQDMMRRLDQHLGDWPLRPFEPQLIPPLAGPSEPVVVAVDKNIPQTTVLFGQWSIDKDNPDHYPLRVMNFILGGGGFNSRLMQELRSNRGLAYSVYSSLQVGRRLPGWFVAGSETRTGTVDEVVGLMRQEMRRMTEEEVSEEELMTARDSLLNSFVFAFENPHEVVSQAMRLDFYRYEEDYLQRYRERVAAVTAEDVLDVARRHLLWDRQVIVLVGDQSAEGGSASRYGLPVAGMSEE